MKKEDTTKHGAFLSCYANPLTTNVPHHIENSQLICSDANQLTSFYMMGNIGR